jgi:hypothetical protein
MPVDNPRGPAVCCFCGQAVEQSDRNRIQLSASWVGGGREQTQSWDAHRDCLAERLYEAVAGTGPFFGE